MQLFLLRGLGTPGWPLKRLPALCFLWLSADWLTGAKSLCDYCKSISVMHAFTWKSMGAINHKEIWIQATCHCAAMCTLRCACVCVVGGLEKKNDTEFGWLQFDAQLEALSQGQFFKLCSKCHEKASFLLIQQGRPPHTSPLSDKTDKNLSNNHHWTTCWAPCTIMRRKHTSLLFLLYTFGTFDQCAEQMLLYSYPIQMCLPCLAHLFVTQGQGEHPSGHACFRWIMKLYATCQETAIWDSFTCPRLNSSSTPSR